MSSGKTVSRNGTPARARSLPRDCSIHEGGGALQPPPVDTILFRGGRASIGQFRCPVNRAAFRDSGPIAQAIVVFPRSSVWIAHEGRDAFVADPNVVTIYNRGQRYERRPISSEGDRCDWFAVSDDLARDIVSAFDPSAQESMNPPFAFECAPSAAALYLHQRRVTRRAAAGVADAMELEEEVVGVVTCVMASAYRRHPHLLARRAAAVHRRRELAEHAKAELLRTMESNRSVSDVAHALETSVFHLCRVFRAHTGRTMHDYRTEARMRAALEVVAEDPRGATLSAIAHQFGFASHAHLVRVCRHYLGETPRAIRASLQPGRQLTLISG